jgi:hypothetical protein
MGTHTTVEEGGNEGLGGLSGDVVVQILDGDGLGK